MTDVQADVIHGAAATAAVRVYPPPLPKFVPVTANELLTEVGEFLGRTAVKTGASKLMLCSLVPTSRSIVTAPKIPCPAVPKKSQDPERPVTQRKLVTAIHAADRHASIPN